MDETLTIFHSDTGTVEGPRINGRILAPTADWLRAMPGGSLGSTRTCRSPPTMARRSMCSTAASLRSRPSTSRAWPPDLGDEVERLKKKIDARAYRERKEEAGSWTHRTREDLSALQTFLAAIGGLLRGLWDMLLPVGRGVAAVTPWLWRPVRVLWNRLVYIEDEYKNRRLSKRRATYFVAVSLVFAWFILIPLLGFMFDVGLYLATAKRDEVVYLTNSQEIIPEDNVHSVQGCHALPCTDENSFYFRIRATLFNEVWSVVHGRGLFFPDYVAASVPLSISQCTITSYGVRLKLIMRGMDIYPDLLKTECTPMTGEDGASGTARATSTTQ